jgi:hypothetical protein
MKKNSFKEIAFNMSRRSPNVENKYYQITLTANQKGKPLWSCYSNWSGFLDDERKVELRQASLVDPSRMVNTFRNDFKEGCFIVDSIEELHLFLLLGGHAIIKKEVAESKLSEFLKPQPSVQIGIAGFQVIENMSKSIFQKAPTKKQRMRILKRDNYKCRICGRSSSDNTDITLHVHHIKPWSEGGVTHDDNLITICHTCHEGLDPHNENSLFGLLPGSKKLGNFQSSRKTFFESVKRYRKEAFKIKNKWGYIPFLR